MQAVIALHTETGIARYAGNRLLGQADEGEELLLFEVSEVEAQIMRRYPNDVEVYEEMVDLGGGIFRKEQRVKLAETENVRIERDVVLKNALSRNLAQFEKRKISKKSFSKKTMNDN